MTVAPRFRRTAETGLVVLALGTGGVVLALMLALVLRFASYTLGYDFAAYDAAARRVLAGGQLYDLSFTEAGPLGLFLYPPTAILPFLPLALLPPYLAAWIWIGLDAACVLGSIALLPVRAQTRALVLLLAAVSWPVVFSIKVGQVGPILLLLFATGWRWRERPLVVGIGAATGAALKIQPLVLLGWLALTRRWRAMFIAVLILTAAAIVASIITGPDSWPDFATLLVRTSDPIRTPNNFTIGATAYAAGLPLVAAQLLQLVTTLMVAGAVLLASRLLTAEASFLVAVVASQLLSPLLWDHYALMLLLPVAWLLDRRQWWAALIPLSESAMLVGLTPPIAYYVAFVASIVALLVLGRSAAFPDRAQSQLEVA